VARHQQEGALGILGRRQFGHQQRRLAPALTVDAVADVPLGRGVSLQVRGENLFDARVELTGLVSNPVLCFRRDAPAMTLKVALLPADLKPDVATLSLKEINLDARTDFVPKPDEPLLAMPITAGQYRLTLSPTSTRFAETSTDVIYFSIQEPMPWTFDLAAEGA
jgi:hypothetical protein